MRRRPLGSLATACAAAVVLAAPPAASAIVPPRVPLEVHGHAYAIGAGASAPSLAWGPRLAGLLGSPSVINYGAPRAQVANPYIQPPGASRGAQSWWWAYRNILRPGGLPGSVRGVQPAVFIGFEDLGFADIGTTLDGFRAFVARLSENAVIEDTDRSVTYGKPWATVNIVNRNSGSTARGTIAPQPGPITVTTPTSFGGGTVVLHGLVNAQPGRWAARVFLEGVAVGSFDEATDSSGRPRPVVVPVRNVPPGANKIQIRTTVLSGVGAIFDYWAPITAASRYVLVFKQPLLPKMGDDLHESNPASIAVLNAGIDRMARDFDNVIAVDLPAMNGNPAYYAADQTNPSDLGHAYIAAQANAALRAARARTRPVRRKLSGLTLSPATFAAASTGGPVRPAAKRRVGTVVRFRTNHPSTVTFTVERLRGRRYRRVAGYFKVSRKAGTGRIRFTGRIGKKKLAPAKYRLVATVGGKPLRKPFVVVP